MSTFALGFDMRVPEFGTPRGEIYSEALKMCEWADTRGFDHINVMEHHGSEDGYMPAPAVFGAAVAARTREVTVQLGAILLPLHDPVKVAEQIAVADIISNGRLRVVIAAGYVKREFAMFRRSVKDRARLLDQGVPIILRALSGERFVDDGREVFVRPLPLQKPQDLIIMGGGVPASARRAANWGLGFMPMMSASPMEEHKLTALYKEECAKLGHKPGRLVLCCGLVHVSEDPDRTWKQVAPHVIHLIRSYNKFAEGTTSSSPFQSIHTEEQALQSGFYRIVTPDEAVKLAEEAAKIEGGYIITEPFIAGLDPKIAWENVELLANKVIPRLPKRVA